MYQATNSITRKYVCASERVKLVGTIDGRFADFGHHLENEMGGLWLHPIKLLDGFWLRFIDHNADTVDCFTSADSFINYPWGNEFHYGGSLGHTPIRIKRSQLAPEEANGVIVSYDFTNPDINEREFSCEFIARTDLRPVWFSETIGVQKNGKDEVKYSPESNMFLGKAVSNEWHVGFGSSIKPDTTEIGDFFGPDLTVGEGQSGKMSFRLTLAPNETKNITFYIAGSDISKEDCILQYELLKSDKDFLALKKKRYDNIENCSKLTTDDKNFDNIYSWVKVNTDWLIQDTSKYGRGICAGMPEYPWWFGCDSFYAIQGILALGDKKLCRDTLLKVLEASERVNGNGRIVHEITTNDAIPNIGNAQETAQFFVAVWEYYQWTNDWDFVLRAIPYMKKSIEWIMEQDDDNDGFPTGYGIIEIAGLNMEMIDTAVYTCSAYSIWAKLCEKQGDTEQSVKFTALSDNLKESINTKLWSEKDGLFCDAYTSYDVVNAKLDSILEKTPDDMLSEISEYMDNVLAEKKPLGTTESGWLLNRNWVINTPMEMELAQKEKADIALKNLHTPEFIGPYGMYLNAMYHNATMTISTGVMAVAQGRYGYADRALDLINRMFSSFSIATPGSISEMSPDHGCFAQAWTAYALFVPVVSCFFGIRPNAAKGEIDISPCMPSSWKNAKLSNVLILDGSISLSYKRVDEKDIWDIKNTTSYPIVFLGKRLEPGDTTLTF